MKRLILPIMSALFITVSLLIPQAVDSREDSGKETTFEWGPEVDGIQISIQVEKEKYVVCEPVEMKIVVRNNREEDLLFFISNIERDFDIAVKDKDDKDVPLTEFGKKMEKLKKSGEYYGTLEVNLKPGETREFSTIVNRVRDMTLTDDYYITVSRSFGNSVVTSNTIKVRVSSSK